MSRLIESAWLSLLAIVLFFSESTRASVWEFCSHNVVVGQGQCFETLVEAEAWMRVDHATPTGRKYLEQNGGVQFFGSNPGEIHYYYDVPPRAPDMLGRNLIYADSYGHGIQVGIACGCPRNSAPDCYQNNKGCTSPPGVCDHCEVANDDIEPIIAALTNYHARNQNCLDSIVRESPWPTLPNTSAGFAGLNLIPTFPFRGIFLYSNGYIEYPSDPRSEFNSTLTVRWRQNCGTHVSITPMLLHRQDIYDCEVGFTPRIAKTSSQNHYPDDFWPIVVPPEQVCISPATGWVSTRLVPHEECPVGNPCVPATGAKILSERVGEIGGMPIDLKYNSLGLAMSRTYAGANWGLSLGYRLRTWAWASPPYNDALVTDGAGNIERFERLPGAAVLRSMNSPGSVLEFNANGAVLTTGDGRELTFDAGGRLVRLRPDLSDPRALEIGYLTWDPSVSIPVGAISEIRDDSGRVARFHYRLVSSALVPGESCPGAANAGGCQQVRLAGIVLADGSEVRLRYDATGMLRRIESDPEEFVEFTYNESENICPPSIPGYCTAQPPTGGFPGHLTALVRRSGGHLAVSEYAYDNKGRVIESRSSAGGLRLKYLPTGSNSWTSVEIDSFAHDGALDRKKSLSFAVQQNAFRKPLAWSELDADGVQFSSGSKTYDSRGRLETSTDGRGVQTLLAYHPESGGQVAVRTEAVGTTAERSTETAWNAVGSRRLGSQVRDAGYQVVSSTSYEYDAEGLLVEVAQHGGPGETRVTAYIRCTAGDVANGTSGCTQVGLLRAIDGPRTDLVDQTVLTYFAESDESGCESEGICHRRGDLWKVTNALGHETRHVRYDRAGRVVRVQDANGVFTDFAYHPRGWMSARIVRARIDGLPDVGDSVTSISYTLGGLVERMTSPDGDFIQYSYDDAQRLEGMSDALGNYIVFTLDSAGNRVEEETFDASETLRRRLAREYRALSRLVAERDAIIDSENPSGRLVAEHGYDGNGNRTHTIDGHGHRSDYEYDPLNRLKRTLDAVVPRGITEFDYDARDNLVSVTDPNGLVTEYVYDGLGDLRELRSPDTGTTTYLYDSAGNRISQTDARGVVTQYTYDALNRLTAIQFPSDPSLNVSFVYDQAPSNCPAAEGFGIGRLAEIHDGSGSTFFCHDHRGNVVRKRVDHPAGSPLETRFSYTLGDRLSALTYPSGKTVHFTYDAAGRLQGMTYSEDQSPVEGTLLEAVTHYPFGPLASIRFGNGRLLEKAYDANYAIGGLSSSAPDGLNLQFEVDVLGNIVAITPEPGQTQEAARRYEYDALSRLTEVRDANLALIEAFGYDPTGNRTTKTWQGNQQSYVYAPGSHWLLDTGTDQRTYDAAGNLAQRTEGRSEFGYEHGAHNRYQRHLVNGTEIARYAYNGHGERTCAWVGETLTRFVYDTGGRLLGEYQASGKPIIEYVYLGDLPVAAFAAHGLVYIETDHLGTPRVVVDAATNATLWHWPLTGRAFGEHDPVAPAQEGNAPFVFGLRYPGQRADGESGLNYNYFRDYEPGTGRYTQSDPIGLIGGISSYGYANVSPMHYIDHLGLFPGYSWELDPTSPRPGRACREDLCNPLPVCQWTYSKFSECLDFCTSRTNLPEFAMAALALSAPDVFELPNGPNAPPKPYADCGPLRKAARWAKWGSGAYAVASGFSCSAACLHFPCLVDY